MAQLGSYNLTGRKLRSLSEPHPVHMPVYRQHNLLSRIRRKDAKMHRGIVKVNALIYQLID